MIIILPSEIAEKVMVLNEVIYLQETLPFGKGRYRGIYLS
jgi:hypothetical protein